jgi:hypothetical protein
MFGRYENAYKIFAGNLEGRDRMENLFADRAEI